MGILDYLGSLFGYIIFFGYKISGVYVVGILLFTIAVRLVMLPSSVKQQKTSAKQARLAPKLKELQEMYKNNPQKMQEEQQKLYARENANPMSGCLPLLIQFPVIIGLYSAITKPLMCVLHISVDKVNQALQLVGLDKAGYGQLDFISQFGTLREKVVASNIFNGQELSELDGLANGAFNFFGINLLGTPSYTQISILILIPVLCFVTSMAMSIIMNTGTSRRRMHEVGYAAFHVAVFYVYRILGAGRCGSLLDFLQPCIDCSDRGHEQILQLVGNERTG